MNTLSRAITAQFFPNPDSYNAFRKQWSALINSERKHELSAAHHLLYLALIGKDWRKAFTPPSNQRKLDNGAFLGWRIFPALQSLHFQHLEQELLAPFDGLITQQMLSELRNWLPTVNSYTYKHSDFKGSFPFDAYSEKKDVKTLLPFGKEGTHG